MQYHQSVSNTVAKRGSGSEMNKWRDAGVDPELLYEVAPCSEVSMNQEELTPSVAAREKILLAREAARQALQTAVTLEQD